jgi:YVTN family beta-propeller protein
VRLNLKIYFSKLSCLLILLAVPVAASSSFIWVLNLGKAGDSSGSIDVIDPATNKVVQTIDGIPKPSGAVFSPDGSRAYVTSQTTEHNLYVLDTKTGKTINKVLLSGRPNLPAISKDGKRVFVCVRDPGPARSTTDKALPKDESDQTVQQYTGALPSLTGAVDIVDTTSLEKVKSIPMEGAMQDCSTTPDDKYLLAGSLDGQYLAVIDLNTDQVAWQVPFDRATLSVVGEAGSDGSTRRVFVELWGWRGFAVVDFASHKEIARIKLPVEPSRYTDAVLQLRAPQVHGSMIAPDGKTLWIASWDANSVFVYSLPDLNVLGYTPLPVPETPGQPAVVQSSSPLARRPGSRPNWLTFTPDGKTVYVVCGDTNSVVAIDATTRKQVAIIPTGKDGEHVHTLVPR